MELVDCQGQLWRLLHFIYLFFSFSENVHIVRAWIAQFIDMNVERAGWITPHAIEFFERASIGIFVCLLQIAVELLPPPPLPSPSQWAIASIDIYRQIWNLFRFRCTYKCHQYIPIALISAHSTLNTYYFRVVWEHKISNEITQQERKPVFVADGSNYNATIKPTSSKFLQHFGVYHFTVLHIFSSSIALAVSHIVINYCSHRIAQQYHNTNAPPCLWFTLINEFVLL